MTSTKGIVLSIADVYRDGGSAMRFWVVTQDQVDAIVALLGDPVISGLADRRAMVAANEGLHAGHFVTLGGAE